MNQRSKMKIPKTLMRNKYFKRMRETQKMKRERKKIKKKKIKKMRKESKRNS